LLIADVSERRADIRDVLGGMLRERSGVAVPPA